MIFQKFIFKSYLIRIHFQNSPKFICCLNPDEELNFQYKVLSSLDIVEEKINGNNKPVDNRELFLGMLYAIETHKMYPFMIID